MAEADCIYGKRNRKAWAKRRNNSHFKNHRKLSTKRFQFSSWYKWKNTREKNGAHLVKTVSMYAPNHPQKRHHIAKRIKRNTIQNITTEFSMVTINIFMMQQMVVKLQVKRMTEHDSSREIKLRAHPATRHRIAVSVFLSLDDSLLWYYCQIIWHIFHCCRYINRCHTACSTSSNLGIRNESTITHNVMWFEIIFCTGNSSNS